MATGTCESCGSDNTDVFRVHRMYVVPEEWDTEGKTTVLDDIENWCYVCCTHYPHVAAD